MILPLHSREQPCLALSRMHVQRGVSEVALGQVRDDWNELKIRLTFLNDSEFAGMSLAGWPAEGMARIHPG